VGYTTPFQFTSTPFLPSLHLLPPPVLTIEERARPMNTTTPLPLQPAYTLDSADSIDSVNPSIVSFARDIPYSYTHESLAESTQHNPLPPYMASTTTTLPIGAIPTPGGQCILYSCPPLLIPPEYSALPKYSRRSEPLLGRVNFSKLKRNPPGSLTDELGGN
jgi:hypothetical protein